MRVPLGVGGVAPGEEGVLRGAETGPQRVLDVPGRTPGRLPLVHQRSVLGARGRPFGGVDERLGLGHDRFLALPGLGSLLVERGEVSGPALVELLARGGDPLPQVGVGAAVHPRDRPEVDGDRTEPLSDGLPVGAAGEALALGDERLLRLHRGGGPLGALGLSLRGTFADRVQHRSQASGERVQITDHRRGAEGGQQPPRARGKTRQVGAGDGQPLFQQRDFGGQIVVAPGEVGKALRRGACPPGADGALTRGRAYVHGAVVADTPPFGAVALAHRGPEDRRQVRCHSYRDRADGAHSAGRRQAEEALAGVGAGRRASSWWGRRTTGSSPVAPVPVPGAGPWRVPTAPTALFPAPLRWRAERFHGGSRTPDGIAAGGFPMCVPQHCRKYDSRLLAGNPVSTTVFLSGPSRVWPR